MLYTLERVYENKLVEWETFDSMDAATSEWLYDISNTDFLEECSVLICKDPMSMPHAIRYWKA